MKRLLNVLLIATSIFVLFTACSNDPYKQCENNNHDWKIIKKVEPTCQKEGIIEYECSRCKEKKVENLLKVEHALSEGSRICSLCKRAIYTSLEDFNKNATLENTKNVVNEITLGINGFSDIAYSENESGYTGKGLLIGRTDEHKLNHYGATPANVGEYKFIFKDGTINSSAEGSIKIDDSKDNAVYMLLPGNSEVTFENITFNNVCTFKIQEYTNPWSFLKKLEFENCTFNGIIQGYCPSEDLILNGCTFNNYFNKDNLNESNPIWLRSAIGSYNGTPQKYAVSMKNVVFTNNTVSSSRPIKFERIGQNANSLDYIPTLTILDNYFDISYTNATNKIGKEKHMAIYIGQMDDKTPFHLTDDGNTISKNTISLYTAIISGETNCFYKVPRTKIMDRNGKDKEIVGTVWKSKDETFIMKTIPEDATK